MAKISAKKSNLKTIANKIIVSPSTDAVSDLKFKRRKDFSTFGKWIESSSKALARIKLPSKKEVEKLGKGSGGGFPWLLALLGLGGLGALAAGKTDNVTGEKIGAGKKVEELTDISGRIPKKVSIPKVKNIKKIKIGGDQKKKIKSKTLKKVKKGTKPKVKIKNNKITSKKIAKAPEIPKKIEVKKEVKVSKKNPWKKIKLNKGAMGFLRKGVNFASGALAIADAGFSVKHRLDKGQTVKQAVVGGVAEAGGSWLGFGAGMKLGTAVTGKIALPLLTIPKAGWVAYPLVVLAGGIAGGIAGSKIGRQMGGGLADKFTGVLEKAKAVNDKKSVTEEKKDKNNMFAGETTVPFPIITTDNIGEKFDLPTINTDAFTNSSSESSIPFSAGVNNDNPFTDLLLTNLK